MLAVLLADGLRAASPTTTRTGSVRATWSRTRSVSGEVQAGVEEDDLDAGHDRGHDVREHGVGHRTRDAEALAELARGPLDDALGRGAVQRGVAPACATSRSSSWERRPAGAGGISVMVIADASVYRRWPLDDGINPTNRTRERACARAALPGAVALLGRAQILLAAVRAVVGHDALAAATSMTRSSQRLLVGPDDPRRERLALGALGRVAAGQPADVLRELAPRWS